MSRQVSVSERSDFLLTLLTPCDHEDVDDLLDEETIVDPFNREPASRRSDKEIARVLDILNSLPRGKDADER